MTAITQETLQHIWVKFATRIANDGDPDLIRGDFYEEVSRQGGIVIAGRGGLDQQAADAMIADLRRRGCSVLNDPARDGEDALVLFLPDQTDAEAKQPAEPSVAESTERTGRQRLSRADELIRDLSSSTLPTLKRSKPMELRVKSRRSRKVWTKPAILPPIDPAMYQDPSVALRSHPVFLNGPPEQQKAEQGDESKGAEVAPESR
jgi:hypothetical protein